MKIKSSIFLLLIPVLLFSINTKAQTPTIECQSYFDNKMDSIYINIIGKEEYSRLQDSIMLMIQIVVDSTGRITEAEFKKSKNITIAPNVLIEEIKKITLPCLYTVFSNSDLYWRGQIMIPYRNRTKLTKGK